MTTGTGPDAVVLAPSLQKVFVANSGNTLTAFSTITCNQSATSGCSSPTQVVSGGHLSSPSALAVNGSTLYVGNTNGSVAVYNVSGSTPTWVATVSLLLRVRADGARRRCHQRLRLRGRRHQQPGRVLQRDDLQRDHPHGVFGHAGTVSVGKDPVALAVASGPGDLYVANAGTGGGISVVSLSTHAVVSTISTSQAFERDGRGPVHRSVTRRQRGAGRPEWAWAFPGDVMATINTSSQSITSTVNLETGTDSMGQLVSDGTLDYVWVTDETNGGDVIQNLNPAVSDPASQPYVTAVGGTSFGHGTPTLGPPPAEQVWNDQLYYSEGAGGGGISQTFAHAVLPAGTGHGHRQHRDDLRRVERRLP